MSIEAMNWALSQKTGSAASKSVLLILANRADHNGRCWPGIDGIAQQTELARRTVINNIKRLVDSGLLCVETRGGDGMGRKSNVYLLHIGAKCSNCTLGQCASNDTQCASDDRQSAADAPEPKDKPKKNHQRASKRCPSDFIVTPELYDWAKSTCGLDPGAVDFETEKFRDHEFAKARKDWPATWRNWIRNAKSWGKNETTGPNSGQRFDDKMRRLRERAGLVET